jgi:hypothetical protein
MSWRTRLGGLLIAAGLLFLTTGCQTTSPCPVPPEPLNSTPVKQEGGLLLKTGALQLGPGLGRDALRLQSDGEWGF